MDLAKHRVPVSLWFLPAQIVPRDFVKPGGMVQIQAYADFLQPFKEGVLLSYFFFQNLELIVGFRQRLDQLPTQGISRFAAFDAVDLN